MFYIFKMYDSSFTVLYGNFINDGDCSCLLLW